MTLAGVTLAAGRGERLRPLTNLRPKALCPIENRAMLDLALDRLEPHVIAGSVAVNAHHFADDVVTHVGARAHVSVERPEALGTAGALGQLKPWLDGRDVLLTNADAYTPAGLDVLLGSSSASGSGNAPWDGERCRLLVTAAASGERPDFDLDGRGVRYVGSSLLPWTLVSGLAAEPSGLYEVLWRELLQRNGIELIETTDVVIDCGRPSDYLAANLHASGGASVIGAGAVVQGRVERCVVWPGAYVGPDEDLRDVVRAGTRDEPLTVEAV